MKNLFQISVLTVALVASACRAQLKVETFTSNEPGFLANSHLIEGERDAILVDAQFTRSQARLVSEMVKMSGKNLKTIFVTHAHPDHYLGLEILTKDFPKAEVLATPEVIQGIHARAPGYIEEWGKIYGDDLAKSFITPKPIQGDSLELEGQKILLANLEPGESDHATVLYIPSLKALIAGDMVSNRVHLWLAEDRPESWLKNLSAVKKLGVIDQVLPGHGENGSAELLKINADYIEKFLSVTAKATTKQEAISEMRKAYPDYRLPIILDLSVGARIK